MASFTPYEMHRAERFKSAVLNAAKTRKEEILATANKNAEAKLAEAMLACVPTGYDTTSEQYTLDAKNRHSAALLAAREELFSQRAKLTDEIFAEVEERLEKFTQSDKYEAFIIAKIKSINPPENKSNLSIYLRPADMHHAKAVQKALPNCTITEDESIALGGVKIASGKILYNYSFGDALAEERELFYQTSGLLI